METNKTQYALLECNYHLDESRGFMRFIVLKSLNMSVSNISLFACSWLAVSSQIIVVGKMRQFYIEASPSSGKHFLIINALRLTSDIYT